MSCPIHQLHVWADVRMPEGSVQVIHHHSVEGDAYAGWQTDDGPGDVLVEERNHVERSAYPEVPGDRAKHRGRRGDDREHSCPRVGQVNFRQVRALEYKLDLFHTR